MKQIVTIAFSLLVACTTTDLDNKPPPKQPDNMTITIVIYTNPESDLSVVDGEFRCSDLELKVLKERLANYTYQLRMLGSKTENDTFNAKRKQRILYLETTAKAKEILEILNDIGELIESAYEKAPADDPEGP